MARNGDLAKAEYWQQVIVQQVQSGLSIKAFCTQQNISAPSFYQWKSKLQARQLTTATMSIDGNRLLPVQVIANDNEQKPQAARCVQIITPSGFCVRLDSHLSIEQLSRLLSMMESTCAKGSSC
jgi:hypothetical protein